MTRTGDNSDVTVGMVMMDFLLDATDRRDADIIVRIAPIARELGMLASRYPAEPTGIDFHVVPDDTDGIGEARLVGGDDED